MKKSNIGFPYPVLCSDNNDYIDSYFTISNEVEPFVENNKIGIKINYNLSSPGLSGMIDAGQAKVVLYLESPNTSFREVHTFPKDETEISCTIDAGDLSKSLKIKGMIVSTGSYPSLRFDEHNRDLFEGMAFSVQKGDILAISNIFEVELSLIDPLENKPSIFSIRPDDHATQSIRVDIYQPDRINIWLARELHNEYQELREEPKIRTLLASYYVLPALVEALEFMKVEDNTGDDEDIRSGGWYQSLESRLKALNIVLSDETSMTSVANKVLKDIVQVSMDNFKFIKENLAGGN